MPRVPQHSFAGGEISPRVLGRTDIERRGVSLATCRNMFVEATGAVSNRAGLRLVGRIQGDDVEHKLVPFRFNTDDTYALDFGNLTMHVVRDGAYVLDSSISRTIVFVNDADPVAIDFGAVPHGFVAGQLVWITGSAQVELNDQWHEVSATNLTTFTLELVGQIGTDRGTGSGGTVEPRYELATPYADTDLTNLDYSQTADTMTLTCDGFAIRQLTRTDHDAWTIEEVDFSPTIEPPENFENTFSGTDHERVAVTALDRGSPEESLPVFAWADAATGELLGWDTVSGALEYVMYVAEEGGGGDTQARIGYYASTNAERLFVDTGAISPDYGDRPPEDFNPFDVDDVVGNAIEVSADRPPVMKFAALGGQVFTAGDRVLVEGGTGNTERDPFLNNRIFEVTATGGLVDTGRGPLAVDDISNAQPAVLTTVVSPHNFVNDNVILLTGVTGITNLPDGYYRIDNTTANQMELVGTNTTSEPLWTAADDIDEFSAPTIAFKYEDLRNAGATVAVTGMTATKQVYTDYPSAVTFIQERRTFGGTPLKPGGVFMSQTGRFANMRYSIPIRDSDAIEVQIPQSERIRHFAALTDLLAFTAGRVWVIRGDADRRLTPNTINVEPHLAVGAANVKPIIIQNSALYVADEGGHLHDIAYQLQTDTYSGSDVSVLSPHFAEESPIKELAYAQSPHSIVWAVREDGLVVACTYLQDFQIFGWHRHDTQGTFESLISIPENNRSAPYFMVKRNINGTDYRFVERLDDRDFEDGRDAFFVDCGVSLDDPDAGTLVPANLSTFRITVGAGPVADYSVDDPIDLEHYIFTSSGRKPSFYHNHRYFVSAKGADYIELKDADGVAVDASGAWADPFAAGENGVATAGLTGATTLTLNVRLAVTRINGGSHLIGDEVSVLANGNVLTKTVDTDGGFDLDDAASIVHFGKQYIADFETLAPDVPSGQLESLIGTKIKTNKVYFQWHRSRGGWVGQDVQSLYEIPQRTDEEWGHEVELQTAIQSIRIDSRWDDATIFYRQVDPLPVSILSTVIEVT